jgi:hypothetical protein
MGQFTLVKKSYGEKNTFQTKLQVPKNRGKFWNQRKFTGFLNTHMDTVYLQKQFFSPY